MPLEARIPKRAWTISGAHNLSLPFAGFASVWSLSLAPLLTATVIVHGFAGNIEMVETQMSSAKPILPADV